MIEFKNFSISDIREKRDFLEKCSPDEIHTMEEKDLHGLMDVIEELLGFTSSDNYDLIFDVMMKHMEVLGSDIKLDPPVTGKTPFDIIHDRLRALMYRAYTLASSGNSILESKCKDVKGKEMIFSDRWNRNKTMLHYLDQFCNSYTMFRFCHKQNSSYSEDAAIWSMDPYDKTNFDGCNEAQQAYLTVLRSIWENRYSRYQDKICSQIRTKDGYNTRAWKVISPIIDYVYGVVHKEQDMDLWKKLTRNGGTIKTIASQLEFQKDFQFPDIVKCRYMWSFKNGVFIGKEWNPNQGAFQCNFYPYNSDQCLRMDPTMVSSKYFDQEFKDYSETQDWYDIPTPNMQCIMKYQKWSDEVIRWMYILGGRLCFDTGDLDRWQVIPFLKGIAKSGKSSLVTKVFKKFYDTEDISVLSNNIEKKFGLQAIYNSFMFIAPEIKKDLQLDQAEFQSIVSGEEVSVARKNEKAVTIEWKSPGVLSGNEIPNWKDNSGSIMRRIVPFDFMTQVKEADPDLELRLDAEVPLIIQKCVRAYTETVKSLGKQDIWKILPKELQEAQKRMAASTNILCDYLCSIRVSCEDPEAITTWKELRKSFYAFCDDDVNCRRPSRFTHNNKEYWIGPFSQYGLEVIDVVGTREINGKKYKNTQVVKGLQIIEQVEENICDM